jgi:predicted enzyme related to lactoylglutathione lyase
MQPAFTLGRNIAMKVPAHEFDSTVVFYRDVLGFVEADSQSSDHTESVVFEFGDRRLWVDRVSGMSHAEIWLEIVTSDLDAASDYLETRGCIRRDEIEPLSGEFRGFWIANPANIIHLITE